MISSFQTLERTFKTTERPFHSIERTFHSLEHRFKADNKACLSILSSLNKGYSSNNIG